MKFLETSKLYSLNKSTYVNLRWIAYIGQFTAILIVQFFLQFKFNYLACILIILLSILTNLYLLFKIKENQLTNFVATSYLSYDIGQLGLLIYLTGGITNPFIFLIIIPSIFSAQYLNIWSSVILVALTSLILIILTFFYYELPHPETLHFHAPEYYLYSIPISIFIGLIF
jgi:two-component system sensor histidine kinase RegB